MTSAKKIYLAVAGGLVAAGVVLAGIGFIASGFDPAVFTTQVDTRDSTIVLGGVEVDEHENIPNLNLCATGPKPAPIRSRRRAGGVTHAQKSTRRKERAARSHALPPSRGHAGPEATGSCGGAVLGLATLIWTDP